MQVTDNYSLPQFVDDDVFNKGDINKAFLDIDDAIGDLQDVVNNVSDGGVTLLGEVIDAHGTYDTLEHRLDASDASLVLKQPITDNALTTTAKTTTGAINEIDASLEESQTQIGFLAENKLKFAYGVIGDGIADDTVALNNMFADLVNDTIIIPKGTYRITNTLFHDGNCSIELDDNATIIMDSVGIVDFMFKYNSIKPYTQWSDLAVRKHISGGKLDGNNKCKNILEMSLYTNFTIEKIQFYNFLEKGIITRGQLGLPSGGLMGHELYFKNDSVVCPTGNLGSIAIWNNGNDNKFYDITIVNCALGIHTFDGIFTKIHAWLSIKELIPTSTFARCCSSLPLFNECIIDTIRYGFKTGYNLDTGIGISNSIQKLRVNNPWFMNNETYYTDVSPTFYRTNYPPVMFDGYDDSCIFYVKGLISTYSSAYGIKGVVAGVGENNVVVGDGVRVTSHYNKLHVFNDCIFGLSATVYNKTGFMQEKYTGTFLPTIYGDVVAGTQTYDTRTGYYTTVGNLCYFTLKVKATLDALIDGYLKIKNLPFGVAQDAAVIIGYKSNSVAGYSSMNAELVMSGDIKLYKYTDGAVSLVSAVPFRSISVELHISGVYIMA